MRASWIIGLCVSLSAVACQKTEEAPQGTKPAETTQAVQPAPASQPAQPEAPKVEPPAGARVFFVEPKDGAEVKGALVEGKVPVKFVMGAENIAVREAGQQVQGTGHHHLIVDGEHIMLGNVVPKDDTHVHFGKGQTEASLMLTPGDHTITMQFADGAHLSYGQALSATVKIKVSVDPNAKPPAPAPAPAPAAAPTPAAK